MKDNNRLHTAGQSRNVPKLMVLLGRQEQELRCTEYDKWGNLLGEENPERLEQPIRLPGQQYDEESGLHYNRHRYYEPGLGRYITQDPIGLEGGWNPYSYPLNPVLGIDPLGLQGFESFGKEFVDYCGAMNSAATHLSSEDAETVRYNMQTMHNAYNPLSEYVFGISVGSVIAGLAGTSFGTVTVAEKGSACLKDVAESIIKDGEKDPSSLALTCGKSFINEGGSSFQGKVSDYLIDTLSTYKQKQ